MKILILLLFLFPTALFAQLLEQRDIDIFIENKERFQTFIIEFIIDKDDDENIVYKNEDWANYFKTVTVTLSLDSAETFLREFRVVLDVDIPDEMEFFFRDIGWANNGHRKFWTISVAFGFIVEMQFIRMGLLTDRSYDLLMDMLGTFSDFDQELIFENYDRLLSLFMGAD